MPDIVEEVLLRNKRKKVIVIDSYKKEVIPTDGLVAYYPFNGNANDESGNGNDGIVVGATFQSGEGKNGAYDFDGVDDYININSSLNDLASTATGTWSAWVKLVDALNVESFICFGDTDANSFIELINAAQYLTAILRNSGTNQWRVETTGLSLFNNAWVHVALVQDGTEPILYVNGVKPAQSFSVQTDKTSWFNSISGIDNGRVGSRNRNNQGEELLFNGVIDEVMIFNHSLSQVEIQTIYDADKSHYGH